MAYGTSSLGRVRSELRSWRPRTASGSLRTPGESTLAPRSSNATDFSSYASQDRVLRTYGSRVALTRRRTTMADRSGLRLVGFIFASVTFAVMLTAAMVVKGYSDGVYSLESAAIEGR